MSFTSPLLNRLDIHDRPGACGSCPYGTTGCGFVPTWNSGRARVAWLAEAVGDTEIADKQPLVGGTGRFFMHIVERRGYTRADCLIANTLSCKPPENHYPTGRLRKDAEAYCRVFDGLQGIGLEPGGLASWPADCLVFSVHPAAVLRSQQMLPLLEAVVDKAFRLAEQGRKPLVLLGEIAKHLVAPEFCEGVTKWIGHVESLAPGELQRRLSAVPLRDSMGAWWSRVKGETNAI